MRINCWNICNIFFQIKKKKDENIYRKFKGEEKKSKQMKINGEHNDTLQALRYWKYTYRAKGYAMDKLHLFTLPVRIFRSKSTKIKNNHKYNGWNLFKEDSESPL